MKLLKKYWWIVLAVVPLLAVGGFVLWASAASGPMPEALAALQSDSQVTVESGQWLTFRPARQPQPAGLIFYPGGKVDYRAYAPAMRTLAVEGYTAVIVPMPLNLAVFAPDKAGEVIAALPEVKAWAVGGHSLGGSMAAHFAYGHPSAVQGLVLWASYPASSESLSSTTLKVVSISGTLDGLATPAKIDASRPLLPAGTRWVPIASGNHAQFGWYGPQAGDNPAAITREEQQKQVIAATLELLKSLTAL
jgi:pimeloyl-ACP methyl ester carboxylesterase